MSIDLLAFDRDPHEIEIGLDSMVARYSASGLSVSLCDLTKAELSRKGTCEERRMCRRVR